MAIPNLAIDKLRNDQNAKITIIIPNQGKISGGEKARPTAISGFTMGEFSMSGNASYNTPFESSAQQGLSDTVNQITTAINTFTGSEFSQMQLKNLQQTVSMWSASGKPSFTVTLLFIQLRATEKHGTSVLEPIKKLNAGVYPIVASKFTLNAPFGYTVKGETSVNTSTLSIGRWFLAQNLIMTGVNPTFSQEVVASGAPLYAQVQVTFEPYRAVSIDEVNNWFKI